MKYEELIANLQYDMLLAEWRNCIKVIDAIEGAIEGILSETEKRKQYCEGLPQEIAYTWFAGVLSNLLWGDGNEIRHKINHLKKSCWDVRNAEHGFSTYQLTQWRKKYAELEIENVGLKAQIEELRRKLNNKIAAKGEEK